MQLILIRTLPFVLVCIGSAPQNVAGNCQFAFGTVALCDWTPWSSFSCTGCCDGSATHSTRTRGVCCGSHLNTATCLSTCGIHTNSAQRTDTRGCSVCSCGTGPVGSGPGNNGCNTGSGAICYQDDDDVSACEDDCGSYGNQWGQCVRDCSVYKAESFCRILNVSLFVLGMITGALIIALITLILKRRDTSRSVSPSDDDVSDNTSLEGPHPGKMSIADRRVNRVSTVSRENTWASGISGWN